jgi:uncharacterized protein YkwD
MIVARFTGANASRRCATRHIRRRRDASLLKGRPRRADHRGRTMPTTTMTTTAQPATRTTATLVLTALTSVALVLSATTAAGAGAPPARPADPVTAAAADPVALEGAFVARINELRTRRGLPALAPHPQLVAQARSWAATMAARGAISHAPDLSVGIDEDWSKLGENVGRGGDVQRIFDAFVASPGHLANLLDPMFTHLGVGVVVAPDGVIYTVHRFMGIRAPQPAPAPPPPPPPPPTDPVATTAPATSAPATTSVPPTTAAVDTPEPSDPAGNPPPGPHAGPPGKLGAIDRIPDLLRAEATQRARTTS